MSYAHRTRDGGSQAAKCFKLFSFVVEEEKAIEITEFIYKV
jgi:hypothetical protein